MRSIDKTTSKQALKELKENAQEICKWELDRLEIIEKDLEVLEILKNYSDYYTCCDTYGYGESCLNIVIHDDIEEYTIIKEWLEHE